MNENIILHFIQKAYLIIDDLFENNNSSAVLKIKSFFYFEILSMKYQFDKTKNGLILSRLVKRILKMLKKKNLDNSFILMCKAMCRFEEALLDQVNAATVEEFRKSAVKEFQANIGTFEGQGLMYEYNKALLDKETLVSGCMEQRCKDYFHK